MVVPQNATELLTRFTGDSERIWQFSDDLTEPSVTGNTGIVPNKFFKEIQLKEKNAFLSSAKQNVPRRK